MHLNKLFKPIDDEDDEGEDVEATSRRHTIRPDKHLPEDGRSTPGLSERGMSLADHHHLPAYPDFVVRYQLDEPDLPHRPSIIWDPAVFGEGLEQKWKYIENGSQTSLNETTSSVESRICSQSHGVRVKYNAQWHRILLQSIIPLVLAGCSLIFAGWLLVWMQDKSPAFERWRELTILVTPLLGLKAQVELTSVSRFSLHVSLGQISKSERLNYCIADVAVSLVQAVMAAIFSGYFALGFVYLRGGRNMRNGYLDIWILLAIACLAACITCIITSVTSLAATVLCFKYRLDPNNVAVPIVACVGDATTLLVLQLLAEFFYENQHLSWIAPMVVIPIILLTPFLCYIAYSHPHTRSSLFACWFPTLIAAAISCSAGVILESEGNKVVNMELYQPLITGVGGTIVAMHSTYLIVWYHAKSKPGSIPNTGDGKPAEVCFYPHTICFPKKVHTSSYVVLLGITLPAQAIFSVCMWRLIPEHSKACYWIFFPLYISSCLIQATILLYLTHIFVNILWKSRIDPGFYVIPCLHSFGNILGTFFLLLCCKTYKIESCTSGLDPNHIHHF